MIRDFRVIALCYLAVPAIVFTIHTLQIEAHNVPVPYWADNLPDDDRIAAQEWNRRVLKKFPVGSDAQSMISELKREGFTILKNPDLSYAYHIVNVYKRSKSRQIEWRQDDNGRVTEISGTLSILYPD